MKEKKDIRDKQEEAVRCAQDSRVKETPGKSEPDFRILTESWNRVTAVPSMIYMKEIDRLLMLMSCDYVGKYGVYKAVLIHSDDRGVTWSDPRYVASDKQVKPCISQGYCTGLTYVASGRLLLILSSDQIWRSDDYGVSWGSPATMPPISKDNKWIQWDPFLVDTNPHNEKGVRLMATGYSRENGCSHAHIRFSDNEGISWHEQICVPEWKDVNEVALVRAANGDIVAACRMDTPREFKEKGVYADHYGGLGVSASKDGGHTWSSVKRLFEWGRHHPSMVLMPNGDIVMTYVVRLGYPDTPGGYRQFGIEAIVSRDNGQSWNTDHCRVLAKWKANRKGENAWKPIIHDRDPENPRAFAWWASPQATSTVLLPGGCLATAFGTGYRSQPNDKGWPEPRDIGLVRWRLG